MAMSQTALTLAAAAHLAGIDKSTLRRAVKAGKLSAARDEHGIWRIEACEVGRLYPLAAPEEQRPAAVPEAPTRHAPGDAAADALVALLREQLTDMRQDRDAWRDQAQRLALPGPARKPMTWWRWLRTTTG